MTWWSGASRVMCMKYLKPENWILFEIRIEIYYNYRWSHRLTITYKFKLFKI